MSTQITTLYDSGMITPAYCIVKVPEAGDYTGLDVIRLKEIEG